MATSDGTVPSTQDVYTRMKAVGAEEDDEEEEFVTASECTRSPSRSSSYHTASDGGGGGSGTGLNVAHWWQDDEVQDDQVPVAQEDDTVQASELETTAKQGDEESVPLPPPPPPLPPSLGKIGILGRRGSSKGKETSESTLTQLRVTQSHSLGITSYLLTSETTRESGKAEGDVTSNIYENCQMKNNADVGSETSFGTSSLEQSSTETLQNGTSIGALSEEELMRQMEESRDWLQLKIVEAVPEPSRLGSSLVEAIALQRAHDNVLTQLQSKQSPVEELLRQADKLISTQRPRAEVYAAMAESLGLAWKDVNNLLELRKTVLDLNVAYHSRAEECLERMNQLEAECHREDVEFNEEDPDSVKAALTRLHDMRKGMLESLAGALQEGKALLGKTREIAACGTLDSRPDKIRSNAEYAVSQVEHWLESLHDQRQTLEGPWKDYRSILERRLALSLLAADLTALEKALYQAKDINFLEREEHIFDLNLGDSSSSAELLLHEHKKTENISMELRDRALKITKATEHLVSSGPAPGGQSPAERRASSRAYAVLAGCTDFGELVEQRAVLLSRAISFFRSAQAAQTKLDQLEVQLCTMPKGHGIDNSQIVSLHSQAAKAIEDTVEAPLQEGYGLLKDTGNKSSKGNEGIQNVIDELEKRKVRLEEMCTAHKEENIRFSQAVTIFLEKQNDLYSWLVSIAEAFLQGHQDMGSVYPMAKDFLELHQKLLNDLNLKGTEIEALLSTLPPILEWLEGEQRTDVSCKASALRLQWIDLRAMLEARIDLCRPYVAFHSLAARLIKEIDTAEDGFRAKQVKSEGRNGDDMEAEQRWLSIQQLFLQLTNTGKNFLQDAEKATDPYLDIKRACLCIQTLLEHLGSRQLVVNEAWEEWQERITIRREFQVQWERSMTESSKTIEWVSKLEVQFYPVIRGQSSSSRVIARELEERLQSFIPEVKRAQSEIELRIKTLEALSLKGDTQGQKDAIIKSLSDLYQKFQLISTEYQILVQMLIAFFKNMSELDRKIETLQSQYRTSLLPRELAEAEQQLKDHEASKQAVLELFKFAQTESEQIISRIHQQEPYEAGKQDAERVMQLLEGKRAAWEAAWAERRSQLEQCLQRCQFDCDLKLINSQLSDLGKQLAAIRGQYGESLATAQATSLAFVYFEKTIEILEQRIKTFVSTAEQAGSGTRHGNLDDIDDSFTEGHIHRELTQLQARWSAFHSQVVESRRLINLSIEYFTLVEEAEKWFKEGSKLLVTIARKSTAVRTPEEATQLLDEVEMFLKPGERLQDERIKKISALAVELYGEEKSKQVKLVLLENKEMLDSFTIINEELNSLAKNLKDAEMQRLLQKKEQAEVDASLSAARAEAAAASAAAAAAEEARKAAEAAAKALSEAAAKAIQEATIAQRRLIEEVEIHKIETSHHITSSHEILERRKKSPSPVQKLMIESAPLLIAPSFTLPLHDCTVQEGERLTLECKVIGDPTPNIVWYKDGISIESNPDYHTSYNHGFCALSIEETFAEDSARFTCKATNSAGTAETSAMLSVKEAELQDQLTPPLFTRNLVPSTAKEGSSYQLECCVSGNPLPTVQWFKNDICIDASPDYVITYNNGEAILRFEEVFLDDQAEYKCCATNCVGSEETKAKLTVEAIEPSEAPTFVVPLSNVMARAGLKLKLECEVTGLPTPKLTWTHNGKLIKETRDTRIISDGKKETLIISEAFPKDAGVYVVSAKNKCGEASSSCNVSVKGRLPTETSDSELASDMEPVKPSIQVPLHDVISKEGEKVRLDCIIVGQPEPEVIWYHDERPVKESPDFQLLFQGDRCSLIIKEAFPEDSGEYKVVAINSAGEASSKCRLNIRTPVPPPVAKPPSPPAEILTVGVAPQFSKLLTDVLVPEGEEVVLECSVHGEPEPSIIWLLNNQEITPSPRIKFDQDSNGTVILTIKEACPEDRGVYTVKAINPSGEAKCFANLIVKASQSPEAQQQKAPVLEMLEKHTVPTFKETFSDKKVLQGDAVKFECIVTGKPTPKIRWCFDDQPVSGQGFWVSTSGERQVLSIPEAMPNLSGKISCIAENEEGKAVCSANLIVEELNLNEIFNGETMIDLQNHDEEDANLSSPSFSMKRAVFMQSSTQVIKTSSSSFSSSMNTKSGESTIQSQSQSITSQSEKAIKQIGDQPPLQVEAKKVEVVQQVNGSAPVVKQQASLIISKGDDKKIHEESFSSGPMEPNMIPISSPPKPQRKTIAPRFISPLMGCIVDQGADVSLEAIIDGYPEPTVTWLKNGVEEIDASKPNSTVSTTFDHGRAKLQLKSVTTKDAGRYTCKIENKAGSASSTADLVVKKSVFPPVFGRRLQAQVAKKGQRVVMEVEVTGTPDPTITWSKDGKPIIYNTKPYRIKNQGCSHSIIIDEALPAHSGRFTVRAVNAGGEAQSSADFVVVEEPPEGSTEHVTTYVIQDIQETSRENEKKQPTEKVVVVPCPAVATEVKRTIIEPSMPKEVPKTEDVEPKPKDTVTSTVTEIVLETTQHTEKHVSMRMQHSPVHDIIPPAKKSVTSIGTQSESNEEVKDEPPSDALADENTKQENDREKIEKELVEIKQQGSVQEALSKFKQLEALAESPAPLRSHVEEFKEELSSSETLIIKNLSLATPVSKIDQSPSSGTLIPIEIERKDEKNVLMEKPLDIIESVSYVPKSKVIEEPSFAEKIILDSGEEIEPGPPPEMGFIPKSEVPAKAQKEEVACKVKKLQEESQKVLSPVDIPSGGVRLFPVSTAPPVQSVTSIGTSSSAFSHWIGKEIETTKPITTTVVSESKVDVAPMPLPPVPTYFEESQKPKEIKKPSLIEHEEIKIKEEFESELVVKTHEIAQECVIRPRSPIPRSLTPGTLAPSAEGVAMEKLWASRKTPEPETVFVNQPIPPLSYQVYSRERTNSPRPSADGVAMDRIWAHKNPERSLKMSWPPQQSNVEEERTGPVWVSRGVSEPTKPPDSPSPAQKQMCSSEVSSVKEHVILESTLKHEQIVKPAPISSPTVKLAPPPESSFIPAPPPETTVKPVPLLETTFKPSISSVSAFKPVSPPASTFKPERAPEPPLKPITPPEKIIKPVPAPQTVFKATPAKEPVVQPPSSTEAAVPSDADVLHYVAHVTHMRSAAEKEDAVISTTISSTSKTEVSTSHTEKIEISSGNDSMKPLESNAMVVEEKVLKPSEAKKVWPPGPHVEYEPMHPPSVKTGLQPQRHVEPMIPPPPLEEDLPIQLEPGPPPEIGFMQPTLERRVSKVESIELDLEKEPSKHIVGAVRTIPPPPKEKPKEESVTSVIKPVVSQVPKKSAVTEKRPKLMERPMSTPPISLSAFKPFPELEPFPFKPDPARQTPTKLPPPPKPSKFVKKEFTESDYESDVDSVRIPVKWRPYGSDTEGCEPIFRRVRPPGTTPVKKRAASVDQTPLPPSAFEAEPPILMGPSQSEILKGSSMKVEKAQKFSKIPTTKVGKVTLESQRTERDEVTEVTSVKVIKKQMTQSSKQASSSSEIPKRKRSPPIKATIAHTETLPDQETDQSNIPKSPVKPKPGSPKMKLKKEMTESGYMADTDEPRLQLKLENKEIKTSTTTSSVSSTSLMASKFEEKISESSKENMKKGSQKVHHHHHQASSKFLQQQQIAAVAERMGEGVPKAGEQGVVRKPQKEVIAPAIVKEIPLTSRDPISRKDKPQVVPSPSKSSVSAQPAVTLPVVLPEPGPPPEERYAPPPQGRYDKKAVDPLQAVETSKKMHFTESSETCHRVVSMEHTTRVIQFGEKDRQVVHPIRSQPRASSETPRLVEITEPELEPFPFKPDPQKPKKAAVPPPPKPKKFTKGEFRESDYESDVESVRIRPIWQPYESDTEEPHYRKVRPPSATPKKHDSGDRGAPSPAPPSEFEKPPELSGPQKISLQSLGRVEKTKVATTVVKTEAEEKRLMRVEQMKRRFSEGADTQKHFQPVARHSDYPDSITLEPGEKPEYGFVGVPASATQVASHHMSEMSQTFKSKAQQFVNEIMHMPTESSTEPKPNGIQQIKKAEGEDVKDTEPQAYREESRMSQFGTKCIDPDTGLIYFKYDFGYEFGVLLPGEGAGMGSNKAVSGGDGISSSKSRDDDIAVPVIHEKSGTPDVKATSEKPISKLGGQSGPKEKPAVPQFRPKKFTHLKSVKWEPTSESELSDAEGTLPRGGGPRRLPQPTGGVSQPRIIIPTSPSIPPPLSSSPSSWKWVSGGEGGTISPLSLSPQSLPSFSPHPQHQGGNVVAPLRVTPGADSTASPSMPSPWTESGMSPASGRMGGVHGQASLKPSQGRGNTPTPPSTPSTPSSAHGVYTISQSQPPQSKKPPTFITPLRDIAVKSGGTARFECIVQAEPPPNILWSKNGRILENSRDHEIYYKNGVCRLTIPEAYPEDAGTYTCTATNMLGTIGTTGSLQVPGVPSHKYGTYRQLFTGASSYSGGISYMTTDPSYPLALALPLSPPSTPATNVAKHEWPRGTQSKIATTPDETDEAGTSLLMGE